MKGIGDDSRMAYLFQISQVGLEMVLPIFVGVYADEWLQTGPWLVVAGAVLGFTGGIWHLVRLANKPPPEEPRRPKP